MYDGVLSVYYKIKLRFSHIGQEKLKKEPFENICVELDRETAKN